MEFLFPVLLPGELGPQLWPLCAGAEEGHAHSHVSSLARAEVGRRTDTALSLDGANVGKLCNLMCECIGVYVRETQGSSALFCGYHPRSINRKGSGTWPEHWDQGGACGTAPTPSSRGIVS